MTRHVHDRKRILRMKMGPGRRPGNNTFQYTATRTTGQRAFLQYMLFWRPFESTTTVANMPVSLGIRSLVFGSAFLSYSWESKIALFS